MSDKPLSSGLPRPDTLSAPSAAAAAPVSPQKKGWRDVWHVYTKAGIDRTTIAYLSWNRRGNR